MDQRQLINIYINKRQVCLFCEKIYFLKFLAFKLNYQLDGSWKN